MSEEYQERWTLEIDCSFGCDFAVCLASEVRLSYKVGTKNQKTKLNKKKEEEKK